MVAENLIRTLKTKIFKHIKTVSKDADFNVLDNIVYKYNNIVHRSIKMKLINVTADSYAEYNEDSNEKDPKFKVIMLGFQNKKKFLIKDTLKVGLKKFLL